MFVRKTEVMCSVETKRITESDLIKLFKEI